MKVLHLHAGNLFGGIETFLITLAQERRLCPQMEPHFGLCFTGKLSELLRTTGAAVHFVGEVRISRPWTVWRARRNLARLLEREKFDIVICHSCWPMAVFGAEVTRHKVPLVFFGHDVSTGKNWLERWARRVVPELAIADSQYVLASLTKFYAAAKTACLYYPIRPPQIENRAVVRREVRSHFGVSPETIVIVQVSRMERWKGHLNLLAALTELKDFPNWTCWIVGGAQRPQETEYLKELVGRAEVLGQRIQFLGQRADVPELLAAADIHCQPNSGPEPFGITFIEGLYAGLPVVTIAMGGAREIVDSSCGKLIPPRDTTALAGALADLITDSEVRRKLGEGGPARARLLCDPAKQLNLLHEMLSEINANI